MKKVVLYCDRCVREEKETPAVTAVWIRVLGIPGMKRQDVCGMHLEMVIGSGGLSSNGASAPAPVKPTTLIRDASFGARSVIYKGLYDKLLPYIAKTPVFCTDDLQAFFGNKVSRQTIDRPIARLLMEKRLERPTQGVYRRPGHTIPEPTTEADAIAIATKIIRALPGIRSTFVSAKAGIPGKRWKPLLALLREHGVKTKGEKSAMRMYPPKG